MNLGIISRFLSRNGTGAQGLTGERWLPQELSQGGGRERHVLHAEDFMELGVEDGEAGETFPGVKGKTLLN